MEKTIKVDKLTIGDTLTSKTVKTQDIFVDEMSVKETLKKLPEKWIKTVNGKEADENGNVEVETGKGGSFSVYMDTTYPEGQTPEVLDIYTIYDFVDFANSVAAGNNYVGVDPEGYPFGKTVNLRRDLDLGPLVGFHGIEGGFAGVFDGHGHTLHNVNITQLPDAADFDAQAGLFNATSQHNRGYAVVKDLNVSGIKVQADLERGYYIGGLVGQTAGNLDIENCHVSGGELSGRQWVGGLVGHGYANVKNSSFEGKITAGSANGIAGVYAGAILSGKSLDEGGHGCVISGCAAKCVIDVVSEDGALIRSGALVGRVVNGEATTVKTHFGFENCSADVEFICNGVKENIDMIGVLQNDERDVAGGKINSDQHWTAETYEEMEQPLMREVDGVKEPTDVVFYNAVEA